MTTKTVTITGYIVFDQHRHSLPSCYPQGPFVFRSWKPDATDADVLVKEHSFTVDVPADFDPRPALVKALEAKKEKALAEFSAMVTAIDRQISELQAIEYSGEAA